MDTLEEREWWEDSEAIVLLAEWLVKNGYNGQAVFDAFQQPWTMSVERQAMMDEFVDSLDGFLG